MNNNRRLSPNTGAYFISQEEYIKNIEMKNLRKISSGIGFYGFVYLITTIVLSISLMIYFLLMFPYSDSLYDSSSPNLYLLNNIIATASAVVPGIIYCKISKNYLSYIMPVRYVKQGLLWPCVFIGIAVAMISNIASVILENNLSMFGIENTAGSSYDISTVFDFIIVLISVAVVPAFAEEFAFRGIIMGTMRKYGDAFAIIVSSAVFGAFHGNLSQVPFAFILGLVLGFIDCKTNSIIPSIIVHFINNAYAVTFGYLTTDGLFNERIVNTIYMLVVALFCILGFISFIILGKKYNGIFKISNKSFNTSSAPQANVLRLKDKVVAFFTNPGVIILCIALLLETIFSTQISL